VLLDAQAPDAIVGPLRAALEGDGQSRLVDVHVWTIGPGIHAAALTIVAPAPLAAGDYRRMIPPALRIVHASIEVQRMT
jgi:Co/Zn/Cd efflux system component